MVPLHGPASSLGISLDDIDAKKFSSPGRLAPQPQRMTDIAVLAHHHSESTKADHDPNPVEPQPLAIQSGKQATAVGPLKFPELTSLDPLDLNIVGSSDMRISSSSSSWSLLGDERP